MASFFLPSSGWYSTNNQYVFFRIKLTETISTSGRAIKAELQAYKSSSSSSATSGSGNVVFYVDGVSQGSISFSSKSLPADNTIVSIAVDNFTLALATQTYNITAAFNMPNVSVGNNTNGGSVTLTAITCKVNFYRNRTSTDTSVYTQTLTYGVANQYFGMGLVNSGDGIDTDSFGTWTPREGYTLLGWNEDRTATTKYYSTNNGVADWWILENTAGINLYAVWKANNYKANFNKNGGTGGTSSVTVTYGSKTNPNITPPTRAGYKFVGYYTSGTDNQWWDANGVYTGRTWTADKDVTFIARWTPLSYLVYYSGNGADSGSMAPSGHQYDTASPLSTNSFVKTGYTFKGWATSADGPVVYTDGQSVLNLMTPIDSEIPSSGVGVTLYAVWELAANVYVKVNGTYVPGEVYVKVDGTYVHTNVYAKVNDTYKLTSL